MTLRILDTDHISLLERAQPLIVERFKRYPVEKIAITIITWEEQIRGRLNIIRQATSSEQRISAYTNMKFTETKLKGAFVIEVEPIEDERGFFCSVLVPKRVDQLWFKSSLGFSRVSASNFVTDDPRIDRTKRHLLIDIVGYCYFSSSVWC